MVCEETVFMLVRATRPSWPKARLNRRRPRAAREEDALPIPADPSSRVVGGPLRAGQ